MAEIAVDAVDDSFDLLPDVGVSGHLSLARLGDLDQHRVLGIDPTLFEEFSVGGEPDRDSLGVVHTVDAKEHGPLLPELAADPIRPLDRGCCRRRAGDAGRVDADRKRRDGDAPAIVHEMMADGPRIEEPAGDRTKVVRADTGLEPDHVGTEHAGNDLLTPGKPEEELLRREWHMQEEADSDVWPEPPQQGRYELELVVVNPDRCIGRSNSSSTLGKAKVDPLVSGPPGTVELRRKDRVVVVQGPDRGVREASMEAR